MQLVIGQLYFVPRLHVGHLYTRIRNPIYGQT